MHIHSEKIHLPRANWVFKPYYRSEITIEIRKRFCLHF